jgi:hypothetical protein
MPVTTPTLNPSRSSTDGALQRTLRHGRKGGPHFGERLLNALALGIADGKHFREWCRTRKRGRSHHARRKPGAFLVHPGDDLDRTRWGVAAFEDRLYRLQGSKNAVDAVELSAGRLAVKV